MCTGTNLSTGRHRWERIRDTLLLLKKTHPQPQVYSRRKHSTNSSGTRNLGEPQEEVKTMGEPGLQGLARPHHEQKLLKGLVVMFATETEDRKCPNRAACRHHPFQRPRSLKDET